MLTRSGVARRLGKSIATVRRLEAAGELHPERDERGVLRFDPVEVEFVARCKRAPRKHYGRPRGNAESGELVASVSGSDGEDTDDELDDGAPLMLAVRQRHANFLEEHEAWMAERKRRRRLQQEDAEALRLAKAKAVDIFNSATERELEAALTPEELEALAAVLDA